MADGTRNRTLLAISLALLIGVGAGFLLDDGSGRELEENATPAPGSTDEPEGEELRFARTEDGAVSAAAHFNVLSSRNELLGRDALVEAMQELSAPSWDEESARQAESGIDYVTGTYGNDADVTTTIVRYQVVDFSPEAATVQLWLLSAISGSARPNVEATWGTSITELQWIEDAWRVAGIESSPGPAPADISSEESKLTAHEIMEGFDEFQGAPVP